MKEIAKFFKIFSDEARLRMLWLLTNHREICVCDFMAVLGMTQSKASRHLAALRHSGLVSDRKEGTWSYYSLSPIENQLEQAQLDALRTMLANHPEATSMLRELETLRKNRDGACAAESAYHPLLANKPASRGRVLSKGTSR